MEGLTGHKSRHIKRQLEYCSKKSREEIDRTVVIATVGSGIIVIDVKPD